MNNKTDTWLKIWLIVLTLLLIAGFGLCYLMYKEVDKVYAEEGDFEVYEESINPVAYQISENVWVGIIEPEEESEEVIIEEPVYVIDVTEEDIDLMARVVMSESSILNFDAKVAVACTIINRVKSDYKEFAYQNTVCDVVYYPNALSTGDNGEPNSDCYMAVMHALKNENIFPADMLWFHYQIDVPYGNYYSTIDGMNFNTVNDYNI